MTPAPVQHIFYKCTSSTDVGRGVGINQLEPATGEFRVFKQHLMNEKISCFGMYIWKTEVTVINPVQFLMHIIVVSCIYNHLMKSEQDPKFVITLIS